MFSTRLQLIPIISLAKLPVKPSEEDSFLTHVLNLSNAIANFRAVIELAARDSVNIDRVLVANVMVFVLLGLRPFRPAMTIAGYGVVG